MRVKARQVFYKITKKRKYVKNLVAQDPSLFTSSLFLFGSLSFYPFIHMYMCVDMLVGSCKLLRLYRPLTMLPMNHMCASTYKCVGLIKGKRNQFFSGSTAPHECQIMIHDCIPSLPPHYLYTYFYAFIYSI